MHKLSSKDDKWEFHLTRDPGISLVAAFVLMLPSAHALADDVSPKNPRWKDLMRAFCIYSGLVISLSQIPKLYPDLEAATNIARHEFSASR